MKNIPVILGLVLGILVSSFITQIYTGLIRADIKKLVTPIPKEDSVVEVIGRYQDGDIPGVTWSNLLVSDAGQLKLIKYDKGSRLDIMSPPPKYLIQSWANNQETYTPILAKLVRPAYDEGYFDNGYTYDKPAEDPPEVRK